jgi:SanA protein
MKRVIKLIKRLLITSVIACITIAIFAIGSFYYVKSFSEQYVYDNVNKIPSKNIGLVLGTSKYGRAGGINPYFKYRMNATWSLYKKGKIKHVIVSGDNHVDGYNEPQQMKDYLVDLGIKSKDITLDYAGLRTFDSMIRAKEVFMQKSFIVISQKFHNERAIFIAKKSNIEAIAFNAKSPIMSRKMKIREFLAKGKAVLDIYVLKTKPKFLGEKIEIKL